MHDVYIDPTAEVSPTAQVGARTKVWNWSKIREGARIGDDCVIGQGVYIDAQVEIGHRCKLQNGVSVYRGVTLEDDVFVGPAACFTNDLFPRAWRRNWKVVPTVIRNGASIGANATIVCGVVLGEDCMVAAGAVVVQDVPARALVMGVPATICGTVDDRRGDGTDIVDRRADH